MMTDASKPVFLQLSNKKLYDMRSQETLTPEHEEIVKFVSESKLLYHTQYDIVRLSEYWLYG